MTYAKPHPEPLSKPCLAQERVKVLYSVKLEAANRTLGQLLKRLFKENQAQWILGGSGATTKLYITVIHNYKR